MTHNFILKTIKLWSKSLWSSEVVLSFTEQLLWTLYRWKHKIWADRSFRFTMKSSCLGQLACSVLHAVFYKAAYHKHKEGERQQHKANTKDPMNRTGAWEDRGSYQEQNIYYWSISCIKNETTLSWSTLYVYIPGELQIELWVLFPGNSSFKPSALHLLTRECSNSDAASHLQYASSVGDVLTSYCVLGLQTSCFSSKYSCVRHMGSHV